GEIASNQGSGIKPQTWKDFALVNTGRGQGQSFVLTFAETEPVDGTVPHTPNDIFADCVTTIDLEFGVQIIAHAACRHLRDQFRCSHDIAILADPGLT